MDINRRKLINRDLLAVQAQEKKLAQAARKEQPAAWKAQLEKKIPANVYSGLEAAFSKGFSLVFNQGRRLIEKTYRKEDLIHDHQLRDEAVQNHGSGKDLRQMHRSVKRADSVNLVATTAEGIALGALGVGMPDIVLFLSTLLKGIYETAIHYGFDYESRQEQYLILKMMSASLQKGHKWEKANAQIDSLLVEDAIGVAEEVFRQQLKETASVFAMDMLLLKFIQGVPVVGILGGAANPVYYHKVMRYIKLKYRKRYLLKQR